MDADSSSLARARRFEKRALAEIYDRYSEALYRYAWRSLGDGDLAEECVAETFARFLAAMERGGGPRDNLRAYLYRMAHNWITDHYRRSPPQTLSLDPELHAHPDSDPSDLVALELERQQVRAALASLTPEQRQVIMLRYLEGWDHEQIARAMEKRVGAVKALQHRAIRALRRLLDGQEKMTK